jgi:hypothetical protein
MSSECVTLDSSMTSTDIVTQGIEEIEEWNEYDELHEALGVDTAFTANPPKPTSLFEPAPSKTPPPLASALPGGFSFGQSGDSPFASLSAVGGSKTKENAPVASAEQNLAIRQMGAEAAKIAASKKPAPVKISATNPLLTEKTNAKSPANVLSPKSPNTAATEKKESEDKKTELPDIVSPRSIPLPQTPAAVPKLEQQKPVQAPPSMHVDAEDPTALAGPMKETQAKKESSEESEDSDEEDSSEDSVAEKKVEKTQEQDPKDASNAGASVKEGEQEEESSEEETEEETKAGAADKQEVKPTEAKAATPAAQPKQSSSEETSEEEDDESEEEVKEDETKKDETKKDEAKKDETRKDEVKKTQSQDAKDASKVGESVLD